MGLLSDFGGREVGVALEHWFFCVWRHLVAGHLSSMLSTLEALTPSLEASWSISDVLWRTRCPTARKLHRNKSSLEKLSLVLETGLAALVSSDLTFGRKLVWML